MFHDPIYTLAFIRKSQKKNIAEAIEKCLSELQCLLLKFASVSCTVTCKKREITLFFLRNILYSCTNRRHLIYIAWNKNIQSESFLILPNFLCNMLKHVQKSIEATGKYMVLHNATSSKMVAKWEYLLLHVVWKFTEE